jgi:hypothetical protein
VFGFIFPADLTLIDVFLGMGQDMAYFETRSDASDVERDVFFGMRYEKRSSWLGDLLELLVDDMAATLGNHE